MTATILSENVLPQLPSASGVEIIGPTAYLVSDDAPLLYLLDAATLAPVGQVQLFETSDFGSGRIPKAAKPDLESMAAVVSPTGAAGLLLCGSGSQPNRETGYFVGLPAADAPAGPRFVQRLDLSRLYAQLRARLPAGATLNLEAAATTATELLLLQRTVGGGPALLFALPLDATLAHLFEPRWPAPAPTRVLSFALPALGGYVAGFSGATHVAGQLLVTASVEATTSAVADGAVLGSFVGVVNLATQTATFARLAWADGRAYLGKVEGLAVRRTLGPGWLELLLVTDDDLGGSTALVAELRL
ncbi:hypothetical protein QMK33_04230 [Hymenobacter sp. H14-R3]|uniref:DUF6929 family protein n=1 Tax=Hymenobacter sp. H14-R3 TaxID=3046308 RepID=UPI0024B87F73|nr:hypothetical protein [Hymenobacter sp. H14-R3]MDJ0364347.1 hypothetical protein [Hymenobacter sp. H14-R3]